MITRKDAAHKGKKMVRVTVQLEEDTIAALDEYRRAQPELPNRSEVVREAIKRLVESRRASKK